MNEFIQYIYLKHTLPSNNLQDVSTPIYKSVHKLNLSGKNALKIKQYRSKTKMGLSNPVMSWGNTTQTYKQIHPI